MRSAAMWMLLVVVCFWLIMGSDEKLTALTKENNRREAESVLSERNSALIFGLPGAAPVAEDDDDGCEEVELTQCQKDCDWVPSFGMVDYHLHTPGGKHVLVTVRFCGFFFPHFNNTFF